MDQTIFSHAFDYRHCTPSRRKAPSHVRSALLLLCACVSSSCGRYSDPRDGDQPNTGVAGFAAVGGDSGIAGGGSSGAGAGGRPGSVIGDPNETAGAAPGGPLARAGAGGAVDCGVWIDDLEDGSGRICTGAGRVGVWYSFNDGSLDGSQWPAETTPGTPIETSLIPGGRGASTRAIHTYGRHQSGGWGSGVGFDLNFDGTTYHVYDASRYQGVHFWARGSVAPNTNEYFRFRVGTAATTAIKYGGTCGNNAQSECLGPGGVTVELTPEWLAYTVFFKDLGIAGTRDRLTNMQFMTRYDFDYWVDDVSFVDGEPNCCSNLPACQGGVHFADASVRRALLDTTDDAALMGCDRVCDLRSVSLTDPAIQSLGGFECLGVLDALGVTGTAVTDVSPISRLASLKQLGLVGNKIANLGAAFELPQLVELRLDDNQITDVTALASLSQLTSLSLNGNRTETALASLSGLTHLTYLGLSRNQLTNLGTVSGLPALTTLNLDNNLLTDISALVSLPALLALNVSSNSIRELSRAFSSGKLQWLDASSNGLQTIAEPALSSLPLGTLFLAHNQLHDLNVFRQALFHGYVDLSNNQIQDLAPLIGATGLSGLSVVLTDNPLDCAAQAKNIQTLRDQKILVQGCP